MRIAINPGAGFGHLSRCGHSILIPIVSKIFAATNSPSPTVQGLAPPFSMQIFTTGALERWMDPAAAPISAVSAAATAISSLTPISLLKCWARSQRGERRVRERWKPWWSEAPRRRRRGGGEPILRTTRRADQVFGQFGHRDSSLPAHLAKKLISFLLAHAVLRLENPLGALNQLSSGELTVHRPQLGPQTCDFVRRPSS